jgi:hypothetical protein
MVKINDIFSLIKKKKKNPQQYLAYQIGLNGVGLLKVIIQDIFKHVQYQILGIGHYFLLPNF